MYEEKAVGARIRSRIKWYEDGEKSSKYFLKLETERQSSNAIKKLESLDKQVESDSEILEEIVKFYSNLYSDDNISDIDCDQYLVNNPLQRHLSEIEKTECDAKISETEFDQVVKDKS